MLSVCYSKAECDEGWQVPKDTVLRFTVSNNDTALKLENLKLDESKYSHTVDDALFSVWTNPESGVQFSFDAHGTYLSKSFIPKKSDNSMRCDGFPPYTPEGQHFTMERFSFHNPSVGRKQSLQDIFGRLDSFLISVSEYGERYRGYVLVYFDAKLPYREYKRRLAEAEAHIYKTRRVPQQRVTLIEGGMRQASEVELYILPVEWKPPAPDPSLPSPQFKK